MSLTVAQLNTVCRVRGGKSSTGARALGDMVHRAARANLPAELSSTLGPSLDRQPAIVRIRKLQVRLRLSARDLTPDKIGRQWALAFTRSLFQALAYPDKNGVMEIRRWDSTASYFADYLEALLKGEKDRSWNFSEFPPGGAATAKQFLAELARHDRDLAVEVLQALEERGVLMVFLSSWDEAESELLIRSLAGTSTADSAADLALRHLTLAVDLLLQHGMAARWTLMDRRQAIRLWTIARTTGVWDEPPRKLFWALQAIYLLLNYGLTDGQIKGRRGFPQTLKPAADPVARLVEPILTGDDTSEAARLLSKLLERAAGQVPGLVPAPPATARHYTDSPCLGLLLLTGTIVRKQWWEKLVVSQDLDRFGRERAFAYLLCGLGAALLGDEINRDMQIDPAAALLSGALSEVDRSALVAFFEQSDAALLDSVRNVICPDTTVAQDTGSLQAIVQAAAVRLCQEWTSPMRGLRKASIEFLRMQLFRQPGRAFLDEDQILISLQPNAWWTALHLSGVDDDVAPAWLSPRILRFRLEGL